MGIGAYRHRVTLDAPDGMLDPPTWYCAIQSAATQVVDGQTAFFVRGRHHAGINLETQLLFEGRTFQVQSVTDVDERHVELVLMVVEVVGRHGDSVAVVYPPPTITTPPVSSNVTSGASVTLTVVATGRAPLAYQWLKNGAAIAGATNQFYVAGPLTVTATYAVTVTNAYGSVTSAPATLTVNYQATVLAHGASHYWPLDDPSGATARNLVMANPGTISGGVTLNQPGAGTSKCMTFNGTSGKIVTAATVVMPPTFTLEAWIKVNAAAPAAELPYLMLNFPAAEWVNAKLYPVSGRRPGVQTPFGYAPLCGSSVSNDAWHHVVWVFENTVAAKGFIDGAAVSVSDAGPGAARTGSTGVCEIGYSSGHGTYWPGALQDVAIYPRALTPAEIANHYATGIAR